MSDAGPSASYPPGLIDMEDFDQTWRFWLHKLHPHTAVDDHHSPLLGSLVLKFQPSNPGGVNRFFFLLFSALTLAGLESPRFNGFSASTWVGKALAVATELP